MEIKSVNSLDDLNKKIRKIRRAFLLIYKSGSIQSDSAYQHIKDVSSKLDEVEIFFADVNKVRDIHPAYSISTAPSLLEFEKGILKNVYKGTHERVYYQSLFENAVFITKAEKEGKPVRKVIVYSTPTCSWCNTLKSYLRKNGIRFTDIDVSRDESAAQEMMRKSGQQGVPQAIINGEVVVGFDKTKINRLLEIQG